MLVSFCYSLLSASVCWARISSSLARNCYSLASICSANLFSLRSLASCACMYLGSTYKAAMKADSWIEEMSNSMPFFSRRSHTLSKLMLSFMMSSPSPTTYPIARSNNASSWFIVLQSESHLTSIGSFSNFVVSYSSLAASFSSVVLSLAATLQATRLILHGSS